MRRLLLALLAIVGLALTANRSAAFSILGPAAGFQTTDLTYNPGANNPIGPWADDVGFPQALNEEYRYNVPTLYYACDETFLDYFGARGLQAVDEAFAIMNRLQEYDSYSENLSEFPLDTQRINFQAQSLGLLDVKSILVTSILEQIGLGSPERDVWDLRARELLVNRPCPEYQFIVVMRNYDPVSHEPTAYVNGTLYTYRIQTTCPPGNPDQSDAVEYPVDPLAFTYTAVAGLASLRTGGFYPGLTRDDVGGLRFLYRANNLNTENLPGGITVSNLTGGSWVIYNPPTGTNGVTNVVVNPAANVLRKGVRRLNFVRVDFDSYLGQLWYPTNHQWNSIFMTNFTEVTEGLSRDVTAPDIVIQAADTLGATPNAITGGGYYRSAPTYASNARATGAGFVNGPGTIQPGGMSVVYPKYSPYFQNTFPSSLSEITATRGFSWGSFDGSTNAPTVYPSGTSIRELEDLIFGHQ